MAASAPQKFGFDTCFDEAGRVVSTAAPRPRRTYLAAEVEALQAQAFAEGQAAQRVSDEGRRAQALADIADACRQALPMLNQVIEAHRAQAASLALATGEAVASAAPPLRRREFEAEIGHGSLYIGSPETVARKIAANVRKLGVGRFDLLYTAGALPVSARLRAVELYGTKVIPMVRDLLAG